MGWSEWQRFPNPAQGGVLSAPYGPGVYELRLPSSGKLVLFGMAGHVAWRLSSILPEPHGTGTRTNSAKRAFCLEHLDDLEYRTLATGTRDEAAIVEREMKQRSSEYFFRT